ncbi:hypothetical protein [Burkholderia thailandensis]|uniref:hypothetical protein n=1 Tax=Burkholderia thailandensis TaxID=57975 RepID=UPI0004F625B9|nr:hypothetical protein [Burkholderia thailandensis]
MLNTQGQIEGWQTCLQEVLEHLLATHPEVAATLQSWVVLEARKLQGLDLSEGLQTVVHFGFKDAATIPSEQQRGRHVALNMLASLGS